MVKMYLSRNVLFYVGKYTSKSFKKLLRRSALVFCATTSM